MALLPPVVTAAVAGGQFERLETQQPRRYSLAVHRLDLLV
jgi:hypothetical protein